VGFYCSDENLGSKMKTFLSIIDSYNEIMDFIFPPNLSFFMMNFELVPGTCFFHSSRSFTGAVRLRRLEQMVGKYGWGEWKNWSKSRIGIHRVY
jgi:hypothetical protein